MPAQFDLSKLDPVIHAPARMAVMSMLTVEHEIEFTSLAERLGLTNGNLGSHLRTLEASGYVECVKAFIERRPRTTYKILPKGRTAFRRYVDELERIALRRK